jgi:hypothetical protein
MRARETAPGGMDGPPVRVAFHHAVGRPNYRYSVIPRGAYTVEELDAALARDPVVNAHYAGFDRAKLRMTRADGARLMYASYRKGDSVYWTGHRVRVAANEALITDGNHLARARCGNRLSDQAQLPLARAAPTERELDDTDELPEPAWAMLGAGREPPTSALLYDIFAPPVGAAAEPGLAGRSSGPAGPGNYAAYAMPDGSNGASAGIIFGVSEGGSELPGSRGETPTGTGLSLVFPLAWQPYQLNWTAILDSGGSVVPLGYSQGYSPLGFSSAEPGMAPGAGPVSGGARSSLPVPMRGGEMPASGAIGTSGAAGSGFDPGVLTGASAGTDNAPSEGAPEPETAVLFLGAAALLYADRGKRKRGSGKQAANLARKEAGVDAITPACAAQYPGRKDQDEP